MIRNIITTFASVLPKFNKIVLLPYPEWEDMTLALYEELSQSDNNAKIIFLVGKKDILKNSQNSIPKEIIFNRTSILGLFHLITSKLIFCTHGSLFTKLPHRTKIINLWHGFGFKAVGKIIGQKAPVCSLSVCSSNFSKPFYAEQMDINLEQVVPLGFPRNDRLINAFNEKERIKNDLNFNEFDKVVIWMPTYRSSIEGVIRKDGIQYDNPFNLEYFNTEAFFQFLKEENILCLFRAHPMALRFDIPQHSHFQSTDDIWLSKNGLSLYQLLGITDLLISDVSSVITDYLLIDKPIIHAMSDFEEYVASRPMLLNPPKDFLVGPLVKNQDNLTNKLKKLLDGKDLHYEKRQKLKRLFFDRNTDNKSTERVLKHLKLK